MTREEQIRQASIEYTCKNIPMCIGGGSFSDVVDEMNRNYAFEEGAKWADKTMIEKAYEWLENFLEKTIQKPSINDGYTSDVIDLAEVRRRRVIEEVLYDFKKAIEE